MPQITSLSATTVLAGDELTINGSGFSTTGGETQVVVTDNQNRTFTALITEVATNRLKVRVPFGAGTGQVSVRTSQGESANKPALTLRTSVSGFIEETFTQANGQLGRRPIANINLRARPLLPPGPAVTQRTGSDGSFVMPVTAGVVAIDVDGSTLEQQYPARTFQMIVQPNRDNQYATPVELQASQQNPQNSLSMTAGQNGGGMRTITSNSGLNATFGLQPNCQVLPPPDGQLGTFVIALLDPERVPAALPAGYFSTAIAQIGPFGAILRLPAGTLRLPNPDNIPFGSTVKLFRFDQPTRDTPNPSTLGSFIEVGIGKVINERLIDAGETDLTDRITQSSFYFVSPLYPLAKISGRVITSDGLPASRALVHARGQSVFTNSDGTFTLENIPVIKPNDTVNLEVSFMRPDRIVDRTQRGPIAISANGFVALDTQIVLPGRLTADQPLVLAPPRLTVNENQTLDFDFLAVSQLAGSTLQVVVTAAGVTATALPKGNDVYTLRVTAGGNSAGEHTLLLTVTSSTGAKFVQAIAARARARPSTRPTADDKSVVTTAGMARNITLTGSDPQGGAITTFLLTSSPSNGVITGSGANLIYTPRAGFKEGLDTFQYKARFVANNLIVDGEPSVVYVIVR
jgi:hypothetical protein